MNTLKTACVIGIVLISVCFQGCCSDCYREKEMYRELGDMAYAFLDNPQRDELLNELIEKAIDGKDYDFDKYIFVRTLIHDQGYYGFEDRDVELLKGLGDVRFLRALKRQDRDLQGRVCSNLIRYQWNVDDDEQYKEAKEHPEYDYPKTKEYVFELLKEPFN